MGQTPIYRLVVSVRKVPPAAGGLIYAGADSCARQTRDQDRPWTRIARHPSRPGGMSRDAEFGSGSCSYSDRKGEVDGPSGCGQAYDRL